MFDMSAFLANADYEEKDSHPLHLRAGDEVTAGPEDRAWPGWVWATDDDGRDGYVPESILEPLGEDAMQRLPTLTPQCSRCGGATSWNHCAKFMDGIGV